ncbi:deoxyribonuclease V [Paenibacillus lactis]|uniref:deoxyribonuclease V n=1 Tax=Paenibacillus lactis TaxID=228574 RepID=UPI0036B5C87C
MELKTTHRWDLDEQEAIELQHQLALQVMKEDALEPVRYVAGVDVAYSEQSDKLIAAVAILEADSLTLVDTVMVEESVSFPYIPGLFSFRELPPIMKAFEQISILPQLIVCDGQGLAHPRRFGLACHLGVLYDIPTIGCGKTKLSGSYVEPDIQRGSYSPLMDQHEVIGNVLRTQDSVKPVFVSIGHRISLATACEWILKLSPTYRLSETTRQADQIVRKGLKLTQ